MGLKWEDEMSQTQILVKGNLIRQLNNDHWLNDRVLKRNSNRMKQLYMAILLFVISVMAYSQDNTFGFLKGVPQTTQLNPAFRPIKGGYLALPAIGGIKLNLSNTGFSWSDVVRHGTGQQADSLIIDLDHLSSALEDDNLLATEASLQILGFGFRIGQTFVSVDVSHRMKARLNYPKSLLDLRYGNWDYENDIPINHSMSGLYINSMNYTEIALGASYPITDAIVIGARVKYLMGVANGHSERFNVGVETLTDGHIRINSDAAFRASFPMTVEYDEEGYVKSVDGQDDIDIKELFMSNNVGYGFDLGLTWRVIDKLTIGAALNDIGFINWKSHTHQFYSSGTFEYNGVDLSDELTGDANDDDYWDTLGEDFKNTFKVNNDKSTFKTGLMGTVNLSAEYQPRHWCSLGAVSKSFVVNGKLIPETTVAVGMHPGKALSTVFTYSVTKNAPANFGAGLALTLGGLQVYMSTDHLNSAVMPDKAKYINARFGLNIII